MKKILVVTSVIASVGLSSASAMDALDWEKAKKAKETEEAQTARAAQSRTISPQRSVVATKIEAAEQGAVKASERQLAPPPALPGKKSVEQSKALVQEKESLKPVVATGVTNKEALRQERFQQLAVDDPSVAALLKERELAYEKQAKMSQQADELKKQKKHDKFAEVSGKRSALITSMKNMEQKLDAKALEADIRTMKDGEEKKQKELKLKDLNKVIRTIDIEKELQKLDALKDKEKIKSLNIELIAIDKENELSNKIANMEGKALSYGDRRTLNNLKRDQFVEQEILRLNKSKDPNDLEARNEMQEMNSVQAKRDTAIRLKDEAEKKFINSQSSEDEKRLEQATLGLESLDKKFKEFTTKKFGEDDPRSIQQISMKINDLERVSKIQTVHGAAKQKDDLYRKLNDIYVRNLLRRSNNLSEQIKLLGEKRAKLEKSKFNQLFRKDSTDELSKKLEAQIQELRAEQTSTGKRLEDVMTFVAVYSKPQKPQAPKPPLRVPETKVRTKAAAAVSTASVEDARVIQFDE